MSLVLGIYDPSGTRDFGPQIERALTATFKPLAPDKRFLTHQQELVPRCLWIGYTLPKDMPTPDVVIYNNQVFFVGELFDGTDIKDYLPADPDVFAQHVTGPEPGRWFEKLVGRFLVAWWDKSTRTLHLANDALGRLEVFIYGPDKHGRVAFSTNLLSLALSGLFEPRPSLLDIQHLIVADQCPVDQTHVQDVQVMAPGVVMDFTPDGQTTSHVYWKLDCAPRPLSDRNWEQIIETLLLALRRRTDPNSTTVLSLSGGYDSRVLLAGLLKLKDKLECLTLGARVCADREITDLIARLLGLNYEFVELMPDPDAFVKRGQEVAVGWNGMKSAKWFFRPKDARNWTERRVFLEGMGLEVFGRAHYYPPVPLDVIEKWDMDTLAHYFSRRIYSPHGYLFVSRGFDTYMLEKTMESMQRISTMASSNMDILDLCLLDRERRWGAAGCTKLPADRQPFLDKDFLQIISQMPYTLRQHDYVPRRMLKMLHPWLLWIPSVRGPFPAPSRTLWERGIRFLVYRVRGRYGRSEGPTVPTGAFLRKIWPVVEGMLSSKDAVWREWMIEERLSTICRLHLSEAIDLGEELAKLLAVEMWWMICRQALFEIRTTSSKYPDTA
jgi:hypothetical protein